MKSDIGLETYLNYLGHIEIGRSNSYTVYSKNKKMCKKWFFLKKSLQTVRKSVFLIKDNTIR